MLHFIDFEVFARDWLCVIISPTHKTKKVIVNDPDKLKAYYETYKKEIFVGYNIRKYDQFIFKGILLDFHPKAVNDWIIVKDLNGWDFSDLFRCKEVNLNIFDVMTTKDSLKKLEGFMGNDIEESDVDFTIQRKLTPAEIAETVKYCTHDVEQTLQVFIHRKVDYQTNMAILKAFGLPLSDIGKTKTQLAATVLGAVRKAHNDEFDLEFPHTLRLDKYKEVQEWFNNPANRDYEKTLGTKDDPYYVFGVPHIFAWGGLHGARRKYYAEGQFLNMDVRSYYPSLMIKYNWYSRNISDPKKFDWIYDERVRYKAEKNPLQAPYKEVLNFTYGGSKDKYNPLYDPRQANNICVGGQLLLLDLMEKLAPYCDIIQTNTDGILVKLRDNRELVERIAQEWVTRTGMVLEFEEYVKVIQRDVNNYIVVPSGPLYDEKGKPRWKAKGGVVKEQNKLDYDTPILNEAVKNYFIKGIPVEDTINGCNELVKFQQICRVSSSYNYAMHGLTRLTGKTFRVFASRDLTDGGMFKVKNGGNPEKFANTSINCFIVNGDVNGMLVPDKLDTDFYINMAKRQVNQFLGKE